MEQRTRAFGRLVRTDDGQLVARVSCYIVVSSLGEWDGSLSVLEELAPVESLWYSGVHDYGLELADGRRGTITLIPLDLLDPVIARRSYTFRGISLPPGVG